MDRLSPSSSDSGFHSCHASSPESDNLEFKLHLLESIFTNDVKCDYFPPTPSNSLDCEDEIKQDREINHEADLDIKRTFIKAPSTPLSLSDSLPQLEDCSVYTDIKHQIERIRLDCQVDSEEKVEYSEEFEYCTEKTTSEENSVNSVPKCAEKELPIASEDEVNCSHLGSPDAESWDTEKDASECPPSTSSTHDSSENSCSSEPSCTDSHCESRKVGEKRTASQTFSNGKRSRKAIECSGDSAFICLWNDCKMEMENVNTLFDHVIKNHISPLHSCEATPSTSSDSRASTNDYSDGEDDPIFGCHWSDCEKHLKRGSKERQLKWLEEHFRTRHTKGAKPYFCIMEGCKDRFSTPRMLEDHVRVVHVQGIHKIDKKSKEELRIPKDEPEFPVANHPYFDIYWHDKLLSRMSEMRKFNFRCSFKVENEKTSNGAKWRKTNSRHASSRALSVAPIPLKTPDDRSAQAKFHAAEEEKMTFDDLFPAPRESNPKVS